MTETRQTALFAALTLIFIASMGTFAVGFKTLDQYRTDNETIATLRAQVSRLTTDLHETEVALDKAALEGSRLGEENEVLKVRAESAERLLEKGKRL